jgi:uroporphyrinogen decarboxylase
VTPRERVLAALGRRRPDRIPRRDIFEGPFIEAWRAARGLPAGTDIYARYPRIDVRDSFRPFGREGPLFSRRGVARREANAVYERDDWGRLLKSVPGGLSREVVEAPLGEKRDLETLRFEPADDDARFAGMTEGLAHRKETEAVFAGVLGLFIGAQRLRGDLEFLVDTIEDPPFAHELVERLAAFTTSMALETLSRSACFDTGLWVYDELAMTDKPWISPDTFQTLFLEPYARMIREVKARGVSHVILHCDGHSEPLLPAIIEAGFTGIQSCNPSAGMELPRLKRLYGDRLALVGGIDNVNVLRAGSAAEIRRHVAEVAEAARDGGVLIGPHSVSGDIPLASYETYYDSVDTPVEGG